MPKPKRSSDDRRHPALPSPSVSDRVHIVETLVPVLADGQTVGTLVLRQAPTRNRVELLVKIQQGSLHALVPCRRVNRATDPHGVYILEDGTLWTTADPVASSPVMAEVLRLGACPLHQKNS